MAIVPRINGIPLKRGASATAAASPVRAVPVTKLMSLASYLSIHRSPVAKMHLTHARPACRVLQSYAPRGSRGNHFLLFGASKIFICLGAPSYAAFRGAQIFVNTNELVCSNPTMGCWFTEL